ncbi:hypothetical protein COEREDRAFT_83394, partial [Coemansia reversa NRRL 1564]
MYKGINDNSIQGQPPQHIPSTSSHSGSQGPIFIDTCSEGSLLSMIRGDIVKSLQLAATADEEDLWRLYTKSESLLPDGPRVRNFLWRMDNQRRVKLEKKKNSKMAPNTIIASPDAIHNIAVPGELKFNGSTVGMDGPFGPAGILLSASPKVVSCNTGLQYISQAPQIHTTLVDARQQSTTNIQQHWRRRSSSNTVIGLDQMATTQSLASSLESARTLQSQPEDTQHPIFSRNPAVEMGDLELARPLESWDFGFDPSLLLMGNNGRWENQQITQHNRVYQQGQNKPNADKHTIQQSHKQSPDISNVLSNTEIIFDTQFIDARSSTSAGIGIQTTNTHNKDLDHLFLSPNSLLPHWPDESQVTQPPLEISGQKELQGALLAAATTAGFHQPAATDMAYAIMMQESDANKQRTGSGATQTQQYHHVLPPAVAMDESDNELDEEDSVPDPESFVVSSSDRPETFSVGTTETLFADASVFAPGNALFLLDDGQQPRTTVTGNDTHGGSLAAAMAIASAMRTRPQSSAASGRATPAESSGISSGSDSSVSDNGATSSDDTTKQAVVHNESDDEHSNTFFVDPTALASPSTSMYF